MAKQQVSVPLERELIVFVEQAPEREDRSIAGQIRHIVAEAARKQQAAHAPSGKARP